MEEAQAKEPKTVEGGDNLRGRKQRFSLSRLEILFGGLLLLGLIYLGYVLFFQEGSDSNPALEKRMKRLETLIQEQSEKVDREIKALQALQAQMDTRLKALETPPRAGTAQPLPSSSQLSSAPPPPPKPALSAASPTEEKKPTTPPERKKILHKVKKGETLGSIAAKYKVSTKDLLAWNKKIKNKTVRPGDTLTVLSR